MSKKIKTNRANYLSARTPTKILKSLFIIIIIGHFFRLIKKTKKQKKTDYAP
jgi:hypothetical protein